MIISYRATQARGGNEANRATSPHGRALVLAGAGAIVRERAAAGAQLGQAQAIGQAKATELATDVLLKIPANVVVRTVNDLKNTAMDAIAQHPASVIPKVVVELGKERTDIARFELKSEMMNRDISGKVSSDPNAITAGKTLAAAII